MIFRGLFQKKYCFYVFISGKNELVEKIAALVADFNKDANAQIENGNKAAGTRARKASLEIEKAMKEFRKVSLEESKK